ncbi:YadA-like family protein [Enterobacter hormaechei]
MKPVRQTVIAVAIIGALFAGTMNVAKAADVNVTLNDNVTNSGTFIQVQGTNNTAYNLDNIKASNTQQDGQIYNLQGDVEKANIAINNAQDTANTAVNKADAAQAGVNANAQFNSTLNQKVDDNKADQISTDNKQNILINDIKNKADTALQGVVNNGSDIKSLQDESALQGSVLINHDQRITALENQTPPKDGVNGKDGVDGKDGATGATGAAGATGAQGLKGDTGAQGIAGKDGAPGVKGEKGDKGDSIKGDKGDTGAKGDKGDAGKAGSNGITTTITKKEVDTKTINLVKSLNTQTTEQAKDLKAAQQVFAQAQANTNSQFKSLKDEVDSNKKEARSGAASAVAIASMPQVEKEQAVMFSAGVGSFKDEQAVSVGASFHVGSNTIVKAGVSDSTNNDLAMGAGIGIGF